jgi:WD40 repeat protein
MIATQNQRKNHSELTKLMKDRVALVTGSSRGIGAATAKLLVRHGAAVGINYYGSEEVAQQVVSAIKAEDSKALTVRADVRDSYQQARFIKGAYLLVDGGQYVSPKKFSSLFESDFYKNCFKFSLILTSLAVLGFATQNAQAAELVVTSTSTNSILRYDGNTGDFLGTLASGGELDLPLGLTFGPDNNLFVNSLNNDSVLQYDAATGDFLGTLASGGEVDGSTGMTLGSDNNLYVSSFFNDSVLQYDTTTGEFLGTFASGGGLDGPEGLTFGPDSNLYVSSLNTNSVLRYDTTTGEFLGTFASGGGLDGPVGIGFGPDGNLYVSSLNTDEVLQYDGTTGNFINSFASGGGLDRTGGLIFGPDDDLYVSSVNTDEVLRFDGTTGNFIEVFASGGGLDAPGYAVFSTATAVPEPTSSSTVFAFGAFGVGLLLRRKQKLG